MHVQTAPAASSPESDQRPPRQTEFRTPRRRLLADKVARRVVTGGGLAIIASILGILIFILIEVAPLAGGADVGPGREIPTPVERPGAVLSDEYRSHAAVLTDDGRLLVHDLTTGRRVVDRSLVAGEAEPAATGAGELDPPAVEAVATAPGRQLFVAKTADGRIVVQPIEWVVWFVEDRRQVRPELPEPSTFELDPERRSLGAFAAQRDEDGQMTAAAVLADGSLAIARLSIEENMLTGEVRESRSRHRAELPVRVDRLVLDQDQRNLYGSNARGQLVWWRLSAGGPGPPQLVDEGYPGVTALSLLIGDRALVAGHEDGSASIWFQVRQDDDSLRLTPIRTFGGGSSAAIRQIAPSLRDKGFVTADAAGGLVLYYSTSERTLWRGQAPLDEVRATFFTPKADGLLLAGPGRIAELTIDNPHPEASLGALAGRVWYEGYPNPQYVWQSTGGTDDFEPKLSLTPLMIGTLKGTIYSLVLAIPLGVLGAMYTSQFMHHSIKRYVKPTVEIMAALPSVVLGFLAGLWLAPRVERIVPALALMLLLLPLLVVAAGFLWRAMPLRLRNRTPAGSESLMQIGVVGAGIWLCMRLNEGVEALVFGGSFRDWLLATTGLPYDQRNAIVVGLAMAFAVIPIIFSIAEDAFSNVPKSLVSGSLALGANRWQTVTRVVLPSASPGIFSAIMIGFGRAVGETMIVLMATGNTPILDWNPFNGFRTLSANIAVEIPEAPHGGTLYRTLFLAALILFVFTFITNTVAELVRQRLRRRYAQL